MPKNWADIHEVFAKKEYSWDNKTYQQEWERKGLTYQEVESWIKIGLKPEEYKFAFYLKQNHYQISTNNLETLREEFYRNAQTWLVWNFPFEERNQVKELDIEKKNLSGILDLSDFTSLKGLYCSYNKLTSLNVSNCSYLTELYCDDNLLTNLTLPNNLTNLKRLKLSNNNFPSQDLSFLAGAINLEELELGNNNKEKINQGIYNKFTDSLNYLSEMKQLKELVISNTDLNEVDITKLPNSLRKIDYFARERPSCKLIEIIPHLENYNKHGLCKKCQQPNTSENWCQSCQEKEWQQGLEKLTGQELVEEFIHQQQSRDTDEDKKLKWIPYEQFINVEYLAEGGYGKVYKAKWKGKEIEKWNKEEKKWEELNYRDVVLKSLNNSQNITLEFLQEVANHKLVGESTNTRLFMSGVLGCYGLSQDTVTKNYVMVMKYMENGNLRQCLQNKTSGLLSFRDKLNKLLNITIGLGNIHQQNLVHRDLHSGNLLSSSFSDIYITDLGLSQPINYQKKESEIFGVLPYLDSEVLQKKPYAKSSDIYSWGIVAYELFTNSYPYPESNDLDLALRVCRGKRPNMSKLKIPQELKGLIKKCWDIDPIKRPTAGELQKIIMDWITEIELKENTLFSKQYREIEAEYNYFSQTAPYRMHPTAVLNSKLIDTKKITQKLQTEQYSQAIDFTEFNLEDEFEENQQPEEKTFADWTNLHPSFTPELIQSWTDHHFTLEQTRHWINIGLTSQDYALAAYLRDTKQLTPEQVLNFADLQTLKQEFQNQQTPQIIHKPT